METVVEHGAEVSARDLGALEEARRKLDAYLRAWRLPDAVREEVAATAIACIEARAHRDRDVTGAMIEEADRLLQERLNEMLGNSFVSEEKGITTAERAALLWAGLPEKWKADSADVSMMSAVYAQGALGAALSQHTQRPPETYPMTMETSLSHLPSLRILAGWFLIIVLVVLAFIFTR